jgi:hypothetical protein
VVSASRKVDAKDIEILVLRHQLEILTRKKGKPRVISSRPCVTMSSITSAIGPPGTGHGASCSCEFTASS